MLARIGVGHTGHDAVSVGKRADWALGPAVRARASIASVPSETVKGLLWPLRSVAE